MSLVGLVNMLAIAEIYNSRNYMSLVGGGIYRSYLLDLQ